MQEEVRDTREIEEERRDTMEAEITTWTIKIREGEITIIIIPIRQRGAREEVE